MVCVCQGRLFIILASICSENAVLQSDFKGALIRAIHLCWQKIVVLLLLPIQLHSEVRQMRNPLFSAHKSGSLSLREQARLQKVHVIEQPQIGYLIT